MNLETYIMECCAGWKRNPPYMSEGSDDPERLRWLVRYYAKLDGAGLAGYSDAEVEKYLYLFWDAYIHAFFGTKFMKLMGNFSNKQLFAWIMQAKHEAEKSGMNCAKYG